jgi:hypothetical protein
VGIGAVDHVVFRLNRGRRLRLSTGIDFVPIMGTSTPARSQLARGYDFVTGLSLWTSIVLHDDTLGALGLRSREYATTVIDGPPTDQFLGSTRAYYELELSRALGIGFAGSIVHRSAYTGGLSSVTGYQVETQAYAFVQH